MKTVVIDPGHGAQDQENIHQQSHLNLILSFQIRKKLLERYRVDVLMTRTKNRSQSPKKRAQFANRNHGDFLCSIQQNNQNTLTTYRLRGDDLPSHLQSQKMIHHSIEENLSSLGVIDGGCKQVNSELLKKAKMRSIIIDTPSLFREKSATAIAEGLAEALKLPFIEKPLYEVVAGSFLNFKNANKRVQFLQQQQIDAFTIKTKISGETYYRVYAGAFRNRRMAEKRVDELKKMKLCEAFIVVGNEPSEVEPFQTKILGNLRFHGKEMDEYARYLNPDSPHLGKYYEDLGQHYGVRGDIAFAQALHETRHFRFTGAANPEQHNYGGLGTVVANDAGDRFETAHSGVLAHIQHLYAIASKDPLPEGYPLVDRHYQFVERGCCQTWMELSRFWRDPDCGLTILNQYEQMADFLNKKKRRFPLLKKLLRFFHQ